MTKQKKKRNKKYTGAGASTTQPTVTRLVAVNRHPIHQWWTEKKRLAKPIIIATAVIILVVWLVFELIRAFSLFGT
jgi:hypothetical protein